MGCCGSRTQVAGADYSESESGYTSVDSGHTPAERRQGIRQAISVVPPEMLMMGGHNGQRRHGEAVALVLANREAEQLRAFKADPTAGLIELVGLFQRAPRDLTQAPARFVKHFGYVALGNALLFRVPEVPAFDLEAIREYISTHVFATKDRLLD